MYKKKSLACCSSRVIKYGTRNGVQLYRCKDCGYQFRTGNHISDKELWHAYQQEKQTINSLSHRYKTSVSTIKRRLRYIKMEWEQPPLDGGGYVHLDTTYWGRGFGVLLALDSETGMPLYMTFVKNETTKDYTDALDSIISRGYIVRGLIIDGRQSLFKAFSGYPVQMCQFHMKQIVKRYLTTNPKMVSAKELKNLVDKLHLVTKEDFTNEYNAWKEKWAATLSRRSIHKDGKARYTHRRLRSAVNSLNTYLPHLFTYQRRDCEGMPNTNNKIEGTFTNLKKNLNNHSGLSIENRKRFICGFFLALM